MNATLEPLQEEFEPRGRVVSFAWKRLPPPPPQPPHEFIAIACPEDDGGYSIFALHYPDIVSQGDTIDEARQNIAEAFLSMLEAKQRHGEKLTFCQRAEKDFPPSAKRLWIAIDG